MDPRGIIQPKKKKASTPAASVSPPATRWQIRYSQFKQFIPLEYIWLQDNLSYIDIKQLTQFRYRFHGVKKTR